MIIYAATSLHHPQRKKINKQHSYGGMEVSTLRRAAQTQSIANMVKLFETIYE